jgi:hypothetical protein
MELRLITQEIESPYNWLEEARDIIVSTGHKGLLFGGHLKTVVHQL